MCFLNNKIILHTVQYTVQAGNICRNGIAIANPKIQWIIANSGKEKILFFKKRESAKDGSVLKARIAIARDLKRLFKVKTRKKGANLKFLSNIFTPKQNERCQVLYLQEGNNNNNKKKVGWSALSEECCSLTAHQSEEKGGSEDDIAPNANIRQELKIYKQNRVKGEGRK